MINVAEQEELGGAPKSIEAEEPPVTLPPPVTPVRLEDLSLEQLRNIDLPRLKRAQRVKREKRGLQQALDDVVEESKQRLGSRGIELDESVDMAVRLAIDRSRRDIVIRGTTVLPNGLGKKIRIAAFTRTGEEASAALEAGAERAGGEDLIKEIRALHEDASTDSLLYDVFVATPSAMPLVSQVGRILGPKGLMPNPKMGTVSPDLPQIIASLKMGKLLFRATRDGIIAASIGKVSMGSEALLGNAKALAAALRKSRPQDLVVRVPKSMRQGRNKAGPEVYYRSVNVSSSRGPAYPIHSRDFWECGEAHGGIDN